MRGVVGLRNRRLVVVVEVDGRRRETQFLGQLPVEDSFARAARASSVLAMGGARGDVGQALAKPCDGTAKPEHEMAAGGLAGVRAVGETGVVVPSDGHSLLLGAVSEIVEDAIVRSGKKITERALESSDGGVAGIVGLLGEGTVGVGQVGSGPSHKVADGSERGAVPSGKLPALRGLLWGGAYPPGAA